MQNLDSFALYPGVSLKQGHSLEGPIYVVMASTRSLDYPGYREAF